MKRSARCWWMMFDMRSVVSSSVVGMFAIAAPRSCHGGVLRQGVPHPDAVGLL